MDWPPRPICMPDSHLPTGAAGWKCRACDVPWPCDTARPYLQPGQCSTCQSVTQWEKNGPRRWHLGERCYTATDAVVAEAAELRKAREASPHYPPSHYYPPKPSRRRLQKPPYRHTPAGPGDLQPGTWVWVRPGALHPGWGDITQLAMLTRIGTPKCEVWLTLDGTVHEVRPALLLLESTGARNAARAAGVTTLYQGRGSVRRLLPEWAWLDWTVAEHIEHRRPQQPVAGEAIQDGLFAALPA